MEENTRKKAELKGRKTICETIRRFGEKGREEGGTNYWNYYLGSKLARCMNDTRAESFAR